MRPLHELPVGSRFQLKYGRETGKTYELVAKGTVSCRIRAVEPKLVWIRNGKEEYRLPDAFDVPRNCIVEAWVSAAR